MIVNFLGDKEGIAIDMAEKKQVETLVYETQESLYEKAVNTMNMDRLIVQFAFKIDNYLKAASMFDEVGDYADASELAQKCRDLAEQTKQEEKEYKYQLAVKQKKNAKTIKGFEKAEKLLDEISGYRDSNELYDDCVVQQKILLKRQKVKKGIYWTILLAVVFVAAFLRAGFLFYFVQRFRRQGRTKNVRLRFDNAGFFPGNFRKRRSEHRHMIHANRGNHRQSRVPYRIGKIHPSAKPGLNDPVIDPLFLKIDHGH